MAKKKVFGSPQKLSRKSLSQPQEKRAIVDTAVSTARGRGDGSRRVGVPWTDYRSHVLRPYLDLASQYGQLRILFPGQYQEVDLLILTGGPDLPHDTPSFTHQGRACPHQLKFLTQDLPIYIERGIPIFGICLGFQALVKHLGGNLVPHIDGHRNTTHKIRVKASWVDKLELNPLINQPPEDLTFTVNSRHHQAVLVPPEWSVVANSQFGKDENIVIGIVEAAIHTTLPIAGVQWHPEDLYNTPESYLQGVYGHRHGDAVTHSLINKIIDYAQ